MSDWRDVYSQAGTGILPGDTFVHDSIKFEEDQSKPGRFRMTWSVNEQTVTHTFHMGSQWEKRFGSLPFGY